MMFLGMGFGLLLMVVFWGGLIVFGIWIVRSIFGKNPQFFTSQGNKSIHNAREILNQRYAKGEISRQEYEAISRDLE